MSVTALYGKCRELGYCDCRGFFGCVDDEPKQEATGQPAREGHRNSPHSPYALCPKCKRGLYTNREHKCDPTEAKPLFCDECQTTYEGKPSVHMQEVHGHAAPAEASKEGRVHALFDKADMKGRTMPPFNQQNRKKCPECGVALRKDHKCKVANPPKSVELEPVIESAIDLGQAIERHHQEEAPMADTLDHVIDPPPPSPHHIQMELPGISLHNIGEVAAFAAKHGGRITVTPAGVER